MFLPYPATARTSIETRLQRLEQNLGKVTALCEQEEATLAKLQDFELKLREQHESTLNKLAMFESKIEILNNKIADLNLKIKQQEEFIANVLTPGKQNSPILPAKSADSPQAQQSEQVKFQYCVHLVKTKKIDQALVAFEDFIWQYPSGPHAPQAHFWIAELNLLRWSDNHKNLQARDEAINQFRFVYSRFTEHPKAPDALLKLGLIMFEDHQIAKAKEIFIDLIAKHPKTSASRIAEAKLKALGQK